MLVSVAIQDRMKESANSGNMLGGENRTTKGGWENCLLEQEKGLLFLKHCLLFCSFPK